MNIDTSNKPRLYLIAAIVILASIAVGVVIGAWLCHKDPQPAGQWTQPQQDGRIADTGTEKVKPQDCTVTVAKPGAKKKLDLPPEVQADPKKHVTTAVIIPSDERPQSVVSIFNEDTGTTNMLTQRLAYPWLSIEQRGRFGVGGGLKNGQKVGHVYLGETLLQVKGWHLGGTIHLMTDGTHLEELMAEYRW